MVGECFECSGTGVAERIGGYDRPCDVCRGGGRLPAQTPAMTNPKHTDTGRSVTTLTAPTLSVVGNFVPPDAVVFFDGDSVIRINRNGTLELGPKWADAGDAAAAFFNELVSRVVPSWNARLEALETENERLRGALRDIADERGECGTCGTLAVGGGGGITSCDCNYSYWVPRDAQTAARAALGEKQ